MKEQWLLVILKSVMASDEIYCIIPIFNMIPFLNLQIFF